MTEQTTAVAVTSGRTSAQVDSAEASALGAQYMKHAGVGLWPNEMSMAMAVEMARITLAYGLDPFIGELILLGGRPYVTLDGRVRKANEHPAYEGLECRPATDDERKAFRAADDEHLWVATVWRKDRKVPIVNYGRCSEHEKTIGRGGALVDNVIAQRWAQEMAQKRAKARALKDAFSMPLPDAEDTGWQPTGDVIDGEAYEVPAIRPDQIKAIHAIYKAIGFTEDDYRGQLQKTWGAESSLDLTEGQATAFLDMLMLHAVEDAMEAARPPEPEKPRTVADTKKFYDAARGEPPAKKAAPKTIEHEPEPAATEDPGEAMKAEYQGMLPEAQREEALAAHAALLRRAEQLHIDAAGYELVGNESGGEIVGLTSRLRAKIADVEMASPALPL